MHEDLGQVELRTGEILDIRVIEAPDAEYESAVMGVLSHKGELRQWQLQEDFAGRAHGIRSRFYLGFIQGRAVANIAVWESGPCGDLGHVHTVEAHRRKGICKAVMAAQMEDFRQREGRLLILGTGYGSPAYRIYASFGFGSMQPESGHMLHQRDTTFFDDYFAPGKVEAGNLEWRDSGGVWALMAMPQGDWLRSKASQKFGPTCYEAELLRVIYGMQQGELQARVARLESGAVPAYGVLRRDEEWGGQNWVLDLMVHPSWAGDIDGLLAGFEWPDAAVRCYIDLDSQARKGLGRAGFAEEALLVAPLRRSTGEGVDVLVMRRAEASPGSG